MQIIEKQLNVLLVSSDDIVRYADHSIPTERIELYNLTIRATRTAMKADIVIYKDPGGFQKILKNRYF